MTYRIILLNEDHGYRYCPVPNPSGGLNLSLLTITCQVLDDGCHVDRRAHADAVLVCAGAQVAHHPAYGEYDARPRRARQLSGLLLPPSG